MAETAYIVSCKAVLPAGMLGLMLAAMFSATASMISSQLNVFSGVLTENIYRPLARNPDERRLLFMGRLFTCVLGVLIAAIAIATPLLGGAAKLIIGVTELMVTPLLAPTLLALFCRRLGAGAIWWTVGTCFPLGVLGKFHPTLAGTLLANTTLTGVVLPMAIVGCFLIFARREAPGWASVASLKPPGDEAAADANASLLPARIVGISLLFCALVLLALMPANPATRSQLALFGAALIALGALVLAMARGKHIEPSPPS
jgi:Na+/proline symporter